MAHFVEMNGDICGRVVVIANEVLEDLEFPQSEPIGIAFCKETFGEDTEWLQTSYNSGFRGAFAGSGLIYDLTADEFRTPIPTTSEGE